MSVTRRMGAAALVLGAAAPFAGSPFRSPRGRVDVDALAGVVARGEDHVDAMQLARWIKARKPGLRVIDVRTPAEFAAYSIPSAENVPIAAIGKARFAQADQIVLYSQGGAHGGQAWVFLRALGLTNVWFIAGGLADWMDEVINPTIAADASPEKKRAFEADAEISRYFGGAPRTVAPGAPGGAAPARETAEGHVAAAVTQAARRGC